MNPLAALLAKLSGLNGGWNPDVPTTGVRPDFGLSGAGLQPLAKSLYEPTLRPGEQRSKDELRDMLADVILAGGAYAVPGVQGKAPARQAPARVRPGFEAPFNDWFGGSKVTEAGGKPKTVYHTTRADFNEFGRTNDIGFHFGTREQAAFRAGGNAGERTIPVHLSIKNPVRMSDHSWRTPLAMAETLVNSRLANGPEAQKLAELTDSHAVIGMRLKELEQAPISIAEYKQQKSALLRQQEAAQASVFQLAKDILKARGYDGIVYRNEVEGKGDSYIALEPSQIKSAIGNRGTYDPKSPRIDE